MDALFHIEDGTLFLQQENEVLSVTAWGENALRVRSFRM